MRQPRDLLFGGELFLFPGKFEIAVLELLLLFLELLLQQVAGSLDRGLPARGEELGLGRLLAHAARLGGRRSRNLHRLPRARAHPAALLLRAQTRAERASAASPGARAELLHRSLDAARGRAVLAGVVAEHLLQRARATGTADRERGLTAGADAVLLRDRAQDRRDRKALLQHQAQAVRVYGSFVLGHLCVDCRTLARRKLIARRQTTLGAPRPRHRTAQHRKHHHAAWHSRHVLTINMCIIPEFLKKSFFHGGRTKRLCFL